MRSLRPTITIRTLHPCLRFPNAETCRTLYGVMKSEGRWGRKGRQRSSINVIFTGSRYIRALSKKFLKHNYVTDIITFEYDKGMPVDVEIFINLDRAKSQACEYGVSFSEEVRRLLIHGILHCSGYDDATIKQQKIMREREEYHLEKILKKR